MRKTIQVSVGVMLFLAVLLTGCTAGRVQMTTVQTYTEAAENTTQQQTWTLPAVTADDCDVALPMERPETTAADELSSATTQTEPETTTAATTTTTTTTTAATTTTATTTATAATTTTTTTAATATTAAPTTAATAVTKTTSAASAAQSAAPASAAAILNRAALHPQKTNDAELDAAVQQVFSRIFTSGMTTYDKVLACYNYIISNSEYGRPKMTVTKEDLNAYQTEQDAWIVLFSKRILQNGQGVCDDYSALFLVMTRAIGLDCYYTHGYTTNTKGETKDHVWDTITVGGVDYIFDPQVEDKQSANGIKYTFFCKPYDSSIAKIYSGYNLAADKAAYNAFRK